MFNGIYDVLGVHKQTIMYCAIISWFWLTMLTRTMDASILLLQLRTRTLSI